MPGAAAVSDGDGKMTAIKIHRHLDSETIHLPELRPLLGKDVAITVVEEATQQGDLRAFFEAAKNPPVDLDALAELREISKI